MSRNLLGEFPEVFDQGSVENRVLNFSYQRIRQIDEQIKLLQREKVVHEKVLAVFDPMVCQTCKGAGHYMAVIPGCECDGPRMHTCECQRNKP